MKVLQLIDSLHAGGAERVAVNLANALSSRVESSYLCTTREEGLLKDSISENVHYLFLNKKSVIDFKAIKRLSHYVKANDIGIVHAHSSSFFLGTLIKILNPKIVLIWHDHFGKSEFLEERPKFVLKYCSMFFNHILSVNIKLEAWAKNNLKAKSVDYLPNFAVINKESNITALKGHADKKIVCLANLRPQKDHLTLLKAFKLVLKEHPNWTLHLIGQDLKDGHSEKIKNSIEQEHLRERVFIYGSCADTYHILKQSTIGVLSSKSEGLPLALLEYGLAKLPVVATNVGDCNQVISNEDEGVLVNSENSVALAEALLYYIDNMDLRKKAAQNLHSKVLASFSESSILELLIKIYKEHQA